MYNSFSAKEAKELSEGSRVFESNVFNKIREAARDNKIHTRLTLEDYSDVVVNRMVKELRELGYTVEIKDEIYSHFLEIDW